MSQIERSLVDTLHARARTGPGETDPWERFIHGERASRRRKRRRTASAVAGALTVVALVQTNAVPVPSWTPSIQLNAPASPSLLLQYPTRGSLAADHEWLTGLRDQVDDISESEGVWRVGDRDRIRIVFAGDVGDERVALLVVPLRLGLIEVQESMVYTGLVGAPPDEMMQQENFGHLPSVFARMVGGEGSIADASGAVTQPPTLLVVAPPGATAEYATTAQYGADGRVRRNWRPAPVVDGVVSQSIAEWTSVPELALRVRHDGRVHERHLYVAPSHPAETIPAAILAEATRDTRGEEPDPVLLQRTIAEALTEAGLSVDGVDIRVPWSGRVRGSAAHVVTIQPEGGGVLAFWHGGRTDLRLLLPAKGAAARPLAWRLYSGDGNDDRTRDVVVVAPKGSARVELVTDASARAVELDGTGAGLATLEPDDEATVRAYDASGALLGETPVPPFEESWEGFPGDSRHTRVVP